MNGPTPGAAPGRPPPAGLHAWAEALHTLHAQAWQRLVRGVHDRHAPARHPTLATVTPEGLPAVRTVVLRAAYPALALLEVHTHLHSPKVADLQARPVAAVHMWDAGARLQIRLQAQVQLASGADVAGTWARVPQASRRAYSAGPPPGQPIADALAYELEADPAAFAVLSLQVLRMDLLHLGATHHRRAVFAREDGWRGQWRVP